MPTLVKRLTKRERDVWRGLAMGLRNKEIGILLGIREQTVRNHLHSIYDKLLPDRKDGERSKKYRIQLAMKSFRGCHHAEFD